MKRMALAKQVPEPAAEEDLKHEEKPKQVVELGDSVAARARKMRRRG